MDCFDVCCIENNMKNIKFTQFSYFIFYIGTNSIVLMYQCIMNANCLIGEIFNQIIYLLYTLPY